MPDKWRSSLFEVRAVTPYVTRMTQQPNISDAQALTRHRARAHPDALFLHQAAADEIEDRMAMVNKPFRSTAIVTGFPGLWAARFPGADMIPDTDILAVDQGQYDLVIHAMSLHWANDPVGQLIQCRRALRADGLLLTTSFGGQTLHELRACLAQAEADITGGLSPRVAPMAELRDLGGLLQRAGFALPVADALAFKVEYDSLRSLMRDLRAMGEANALAARLRHPTRRRIFQAAADLYQTHHGTDQNRITATFELLFLTGWAPDASQPKPLRPGSAQHSLAEALGTQEKKLRD